MSMSDSCGCPAGRPLGAPHLASCKMAESQPTAPSLVSIYRNTETGRPVAVPDEIVTAAEREYRAWKSWTSGKSWSAIANEELYDSPQAAAEAVRRYLDEAVAVVKDFTREQVIADHLGRLQALREFLWTGAAAGKTTNVMAILAIEDRWTKAFGLDQVDAEDTTAQTVVVASPEYIANLQLAAEPEPQADAG